MHTGFISLFLAASASTIGASTLTDGPISAAPLQSPRNLGLNGLVFALGLILGTLVIALLRRAIRRWQWLNFPHAFSVFNAANLVLISFITESLDLWKRDSLFGFDVYALGGYALIGFLVAISIFAELPVSLAKELASTKIKEAGDLAEKYAKRLNVAIGLEALVREVMRAKLGRLSERRRTNEGTILDALAPPHQIHVLLKVLHGHFMKRLPPGPEHRLRIGIYMLGKDGKTLEAAFGWDGTNRNCFSNKHSDFMKITNPGGGRSVVVECWLSKDPFQFVADGLEAQRAGTFRYFRNDQEKELRSMVAYRHNLTGLGPEDAFIITLDTNSPGFFSSDNESECRMLLPAFSCRIELELLACS